MPLVPNRPFNRGKVTGPFSKPREERPPKDNAEYALRVGYAQASMDPQATARRLKVRLPSRSQGGIHIGGR